MPKVKLQTPADRARGVHDNMHPWLTENGAEEILLPDDLTRSRGLFRNIDVLGNPEGFTLGQLPQIVSRDCYLGTLPDKTTKQNTSPISVHETGLLINGPIATGGNQPDEGLYGFLPKPERPTIRKRPASVAGYPASSLSSPYWIAFSLYRNGHTALSQPTKLPPLAQGQSFKVKLPDSIQLGAEFIGVWLSQPGLGTTSSPGPMRLQKLIHFSSYPGEIEFNGPYIYSTERPSDTALPPPGSPSVVFNRIRRASRVGTYRFAITVANDLGESLPSSISPQVIVSADPYYGDQNPAGYGWFDVLRPTLPTGSWGWYLYANLDGQWNRIHNPVTGEGSRKPLPPNFTGLSFGGWSGSEFYGKNDTFLFTQSDLPAQNTSGLEPLDSPPQEPVVFGQTRPGPGRYYARQLDRSEEGIESPLSAPAEVDLGENEVMEVVFSNPLNRLPNATLVAKGADGYPLGYSVNGEGVILENGELIIDSFDDPEVTTDVVLVDVSQEWSVGGFLRVEPPKSGVFGGTFEVVLREVNASAAHTDTVLKSASGVGDYRYYSVITPPGYSSLDWQPDTQITQIVYRFSGTSNMIVRVSRQLLKDYAYGFRRREAGIAGGPANSNPAPETTANPSGGVAVEPSPAPESVPETLAQVGPDRPLSEGVLKETQSFSGSPPWAQDVSNATLTTSAGKLIASKTSVGSARASISKTFEPAPGLDIRHDLGVSANGVEFPIIPSNGSITFLELGSNTWLDLDARHEVAMLRIDDEPDSSGNISTTLDEGGSPVTRTTSVIATRELATLTIDSPPSASAQVSVSVGGTLRSVPVSIEIPPVPEIVNVEITSGAGARGVVAIKLGNPIGSGSYQSILQAVVNTGDSSERIADKLRQSVATPGWQNEPWLVSGSGSTLIFTAKVGGVTYGDHRFYGNWIVDRNYRDTHASGRATITQQGVVGVAADTMFSVAQKLRALSIPGYNVYGENNAVSFECLEPGVQTDASYDDGGTGVAGTMNIIQGARDTQEDVAQKIVNTYSGNSYWGVTRSGRVLTLEALSSGAKEDATYSPSSTGAMGTMRTTVQGSTDIIAYTKDQFGTTRQRRILPNINTSSMVNLSLGVSGAGYPHPDSPDDVSRAVIQVWGSTGTDEKVLRGLFEDVDLGGYPAESVKAGVTSETSTSTWEVRIDEIKVTDRGNVYYRYHDYQGILLNQVYGSFPPTLISGGGLYLQGFRMAVLPDTQYTASIFARWAGFSLSSETMPFYLYGITPEGKIRPIGNIAEYVVGTESWHEETFSFTTPSDCYEIRLESFNMSAGEIVCQELCISLGQEVKRTPLYATEGSYISTLSLGTPHMRPGGLWGRKRKILDTDIYIPAGTDASTTYESSDYQDGPYTDPVEDVALLEQKDNLKIVIVASGDGRDTPVLRAGSPNAEYVLIATGELLSTLLKEDRTELDGGAFFGAYLNRPAEPPEVVNQRLKGGRRQRIATYPPSGLLPPFEVQVFTPEAKKLIEDRAEMVDFCIEARDQIWTIRSSGPVRFTPQNREQEINGRCYGHWVATFPESQIVDIQDLPA